MSKLISTLCEDVVRRTCRKVKDSVDLIRFEPSLRVASKFRDFLDDTRTKYRADASNVFYVNGDEDLADSMIEQASSYGIEPDELDYRIESSAEVEDSSDLSEAGVSPELVERAKSFVASHKNLGTGDLASEVMRILYSNPFAGDADFDVLDVQSVGKKWPNDDDYRSSIVKVTTPGVALTSIWGTGDPHDLWFIPELAAEIIGVSDEDEKVTPGYYYVDADRLNPKIERIGSKKELDSWVESLENI